MSDFKKIYEDEDIKISERIISLEDSTDVARTVCLQTGNKEFYYEFTYGKLIHTHEKDCGRFDQRKP